MAAGRSFTVRARIIAARIAGEIFLRARPGHYQESALPEIKEFPQSEAV
jgi:hypothetical protein